MCDPSLAAGCSSTLDPVVVMSVRFSSRWARGGGGRGDGERIVAVEYIKQSGGSGTI